MKPYELAVSALVIGVATLLIWAALSRRAELPGPPSGPDPHAGIVDDLTGGFW